MVMAMMMVAACSKNSLFRVDDPKRLLHFVIDGGNNMDKGSRIKPIHLYLRTAIDMQLETTTTTATVLSTNSSHQKKLMRLILFSQGSYKVDYYVFD